MKRLFPLILILALLPMAARAQESSGTLLPDVATSPTPDPVHVEATDPRNEEFTESLTRRAALVAVFQFNSKLSVFAPLASDPVACATAYKGLAYINSSSGLVTVCNGTVWVTQATSATAAPSGATYITQTANSSLSAEQALSTLASALLVNTTSTGVLSAYAGTTCTNQFVRSLSALAAAGCASVSLSADVTGTLPIANGGTGQTSAANAINALLPSQTSNSGKYLTTNGSAASWGTVTGGITNSAGANVIPKSDGTNLLGSFLSISGASLVFDNSATHFISVAQADAGSGIDLNISGGLALNGDVDPGGALYLNGGGGGDGGGAGGNVSINGGTGGGSGAQGEVYITGSEISLTAPIINTTCTITAGGATGTQTIDKPCGSVNFAAAATSLVVTNSTVTTSSVITCTVGTNDATLKSVQCVAGSGSFTMFGNAASAAETRVNFWILTP